MAGVACSGNQGSLLEFVLWGGHTWLSTANVPPADPSSARQDKTRLAARGPFIFGQASVLRARAYDVHKPSCADETASHPNIYSWAWLLPTTVPSCKIYEVGAG